ncbi:MAG: hypothetical protein AB2A00_16905 [Myxococcota bacterium]
MMRPALVFTLVLTLASPSVGWASSPGVDESTRRRGCSFVAEVVKVSVRPKPQARVRLVKLYGTNVYEDPARIDATTIEKHAPEVMVDVPREVAASLKRGARIMVWVDRSGATPRDNTRFSDLQVTFETTTLPATVP